MLGALKKGSGFLPDPFDMTTRQIRIRDPLAYRRHAKAYLPRFSISILIRTALSTAQLSDSKNHVASKLRNCGLETINCGSL